MGDAIADITADPSATASELNGLAWGAATRDIYLEEALAAAQRAARMEPTAEVLDTLAEAQWRIGSYGEAVATGTKALELSPGDPYLEGQLAKYTASLEAGERVVPDDPSEDPAHDGVTDTGGDGGVSSRDDVGADGRPGAAGGER